MNYIKSFFYTPKPKESTESKKIFLLYGAKNSLGKEISYLVGVFNDQNLANEEKMKLNTLMKLNSTSTEGELRARQGLIGRTIYNDKLRIKEYNYAFYVFECDLNKNYEMSIEDVIFGYIKN